MRGVVFTKLEVDYIKDNFHKSSTQTIAHELKRSYTSIACKAMRLRLRRQEIIKHHPCQPKTLKRMQVLIFIAEHTSNKYKRDNAIKELKQLSGL